MAATSPLGVVKASRAAQNTDAEGVLSTHSSGELVFAVVGHIGSGATAVATKLEALLESRGFDVHILKARTEILDWARRNNRTLPKVTNPPEVAYVEALQDFGDEMREKDVAAVAIGLVHAVRRKRAERIKGDLIPGKPIEPDEKKRAYILDSIRHPAEADLLRQVYQSAFILLGVVCDEEVRKQRLSKKYKDAGGYKAEELMARDADAPDKKWGQHVSEAFHTADVFLDNTADQFVDKQENPNWSVPEQLSRIVKIVLRDEVVRPTVHEFAMHAAYGAKMVSACLSRQVGAALLDVRLNLVATGTNEVPRAGGGLYGPTDGGPDHRCARRLPEGDRFCSNVREQADNIEKVLAVIPGSEQWDATTRASVARDLQKKTPMGQALEFSRAVHAEMAAILAAARSGALLVGSKLYVTTFPCHYCARHIVAVGVDEVQYIEPYPKSRALKLHSDSITTSSVGWAPPSQPSGVQNETEPVARGLRVLAPQTPKVLVRPFTGVAPRLYRRAFLERGALKDSTGALAIAPPAWGDSWQIRKVSYAQLEAELAKGVEEGSV